MAGMNMPTPGGAVLAVSAKRYKEREKLALACLSGLVARDAHGADAQALVCQAFSLAEEMRRYWRDTAERVHRLSNADHSDEVQP